MIDRIIDFFVRQKFAAFAFTLLIAGWGAYSLSQLSVNTIPDISNEQVRVITVSEDLATEEVERLITHPVELEMANLPGVKEIRSVSKYGLSIVTVVFEEDMGTYLPRQLIKERLKAAEDRIPDGVGTPEMAPIMSGLGEIYQYVVEAEPGYEDEYSPMDLRTIQDWLIRRQLTGIDGVVEINSWGGYLKQYEVAVDPDRLMSKDLTIGDVFKALEANNANTGGAYIEKEERAFFIRGEGLIESHEDIRRTLVAKRNGNPIRIGDIAEVRDGHALRLGAVTHNGKGEAVTGQIMMLKGESSIDVIERVKERVDQVRKSLPEGVRIVPYYDRSDLIDRTTGTIMENLTIGGLIVIFVLVLLLGSWRSGSVVALVIPLSLLFAFGMMELFGVSVNLVSLGAIDFGIIVDGAVIIVEYVVYRIASSSEGLQGMGVSERRNAVDDITSDSASRMMRTAFFGQVIILIVFLPILTLTGVEGKMFVPMATTFIFALIGAMVLCFTFVPAACAFLYRNGTQEGNVGSSAKLMRGIEGVYTPFLRTALDNRLKVLAAALLLFGGSLYLFGRLGGEFVPQLDEGSLVVHPVLPPGTSLEQTKKTSTRLEGVLLDEFPEVNSVTTRIGAAEVPTDPMSLEMSDMMVNLKPKGEWESAESKEELLRRMKEAMSVVPGVDIRFSQPIEMLFNQFLSGVNADLAVKIFGPDLERLAELGEKAGERISEVEGVSSVKVEKTLGSPRIVMRPDRDKLAEYGLTIEEVNRVVRGAFSGAKAGTVYEGVKRFDLVVRAEEEARSSKEDLEQLRVRLPEGGQVPLKEVAEIRYGSGIARISREHTQRRTTVSVNTMGRDVESVVKDVQQLMEEDVQLPAGYRVEYSGDFEQLVQARRHLFWLVPVALGLIFVLLYAALRSFRLVSMVLSAIPLAVTGGIFTLWLRGMPFSIPAGIGFIALFGIAVLNGIVLISFLEELKEKGRASGREGIMLGSKKRLRPVLLTALTDILGFLPMAVSTSPGAEVQRPLATVVVGGLITSTLLTLIVLPTLYSLFGQGKSGGASGKSPAMASSVLLLFLLIPGMGNAQADEVLTVEEAVDSALSAHPSVRAAEFGVEKQKALKRSAYHLGPTLLSRGREEWSYDGPPGVQNRFALQQDLELPFLMKARSDHFEAKRDRAEAGLALQKRRIERSVRLKYNELAFRQEMKRLWEESAELHEKVLKAARSRFETGDIGRLERTSLRARVRRVRMEQREAKAEERVRRAELAEALFVEDSLGARVAPLKLMEVPKIEEDSVGGHPWLEQQRREVEVGKTAMKERRMERLPELRLSYRDQAIQGQTGYYGYLFGLSVPIGRLITGAEQEAARLELERAKARQESSALAWKKRYQKAVSRYEQRLERLRSFDEQRLEEAELLIDNARKRYEAGDIDQVSYTNYMDQAFRIKREYLTAIRDLNRSIIELQYLNAP